MIKEIKLRFTYSIAHAGPQYLIIYRDMQRRWPVTKLACIAGNNYLIWVN